MSNSKVEAILKHFNLDHEKDEELISSYNLFDKGNNCVVIHPGSHSLKFGLGSMVSPFLTPMAIAHPSKAGTKVCEDWEGQMRMNWQKQEVFNEELAAVIERI